MAMLRKTKEFKDFSGFVVDSGGLVRTLASKERSASQQKRSNSAANNQSKQRPKLMNTNLILIDESRQGEPDIDS